ncbi:MULTISPECIES: hypothetical protein [Paenibacillus]|uniref:hypothetical protein n=1 Tax=Paenibacillus TaxID=44249 RepID=UPI0013E2D32E|nr:MULTISPECIES: hypothetical protein [Paenibacillus]
MSSTHAKMPAKKVRKSFNPTDLTMFKESLPVLPAFAAACSPPVSPLLALSLFFRFSFHCAKRFPITVHHPVVAISFLSLSECWARVFSLMSDKYFLYNAYRSIRFVLSS